MPQTSGPNTGNNLIWPTGKEETSLLVSSGVTKRVSTEQQISQRDINSIRSAIEALCNHAHDYQDNVGGC